MNTRKLIYFAVAVIAACLAYWLPLSLSLPERIALAIFILAVLLWMTEPVQLYVTSFIILFLEMEFLAPAMAQTHAGYKDSVFLAPFFSDVIVLFMGGLLLARAGSKYHIDQWLARSIIRIAGQRADRVLLALMLSGGVLSMWMSNTATTAMLLIIVSGLVEKIQNKDVIKAFVLGAPFAANLGGMATPVGTPPNAIALIEINRHLGQQMTFAGWMLAAGPLVFILLLLMWLVLVKLFPISRETIELPPVPVFSMNWQTVSVIAVFFVTVLLWFFSEFTGLSAGMIALLPLIFFLSTGILERSDFKALSWDVLFLVGGGASLSVALKDSGLGATLLGSLSWSGMGEFYVLAFFVLLGALMTTFMSNTATANILVPLVFVLPGIAPAPIAIATTLAISSTMILPVSTPPNALAYSSGLISMADMVKSGLMISLLAIALYLTLGLWWWNYLGLI